VKNKKADMSIAVISDIHSNLEALQTCLEYIDRLDSIDSIICLGDVVGYGADPAACIDLIMKHSDAGIIGNHDAAVVGTTDINYFNYMAREAVHWTKQQISPEQTEYLRNLPYTFCQNNILFTHATPDNPEQWNYIFSLFEAVQQFEFFSESICFIGHSHIPEIYSESRQIAYTHSEIVQLDSNEKYIINVGSVGQPRDGDPRLAFAVFDQDEWKIEIVRLEYDTITASRKIRERGLHKFLAFRIINGH